MVNVGMHNKLLSLYILDRDPAEVHNKKTHGALLFYDITQPSTFDNLPAWIEELNRYVGEDVQKTIVGTKSDLEAQRKVPLSTAQVC